MICSAKGNAGGSEDERFTIEQGDVKVYTLARDEGRLSNKDMKFQKLLAKAAETQVHRLMLVFGETMAVNVRSASGKLPENDPHLDEAGFHFDGYTEVFVTCAQDRVKIDELMVKLTSYAHLSAKRAYKKLVAADVLTHVGSS